MSLDNNTSLYKEYLKEIEDRKTQGLHPKPIDGADLLNEIISQIKDTTNADREDSLKFFIYNVVPGTTPAAAKKAEFLKEIILGESAVNEIIFDVVTPVVVLTFVDVSLFVCNLIAQAFPAL